MTDSRQAQTSTQPYVRSRSKWNVMAISNFYEWYLVSIQSISHLLKSSFHSHFGIHRYFVLLVRPPNVICFEKKTSGDSRFHPNLQLRAFSLALVMSERGVEVNLVLIQTYSLF